jgi:Ca-activated chloride channel family protein
LFLIPLLGILAWLAARRRRRVLLQLAGPITGTLLAAERLSFFTRACLNLGLIALVLAIAQPRWGRDWSQSAALGRDVIVVLDLSRSMFAEAPSRVELSRRSLLDLAETLRTRGGHRVALIRFAGRSQLLCPLTHDIEHFREAIAAIDPLYPDAELGGGTRMGAALSFAIENATGRSRFARDVVLLSDGDDPARDGEFRQGAERCRSEGVRVLCVGVGDASEAKPIPLAGGKGRLTWAGKDVLTRLEEAPLREIARVTQGELLIFGTSPGHLGESWLQFAESVSDEESPDSLPVFRQRQEWFLVTAFGLLSLFVVLPRRPKEKRP